MLTRSALCAGLFLIGSTLSAAATGPAPFDVWVELSFADRSGDEGAREEFELQLFDELRRAQCFRSVQMQSENSDPDDATLHLKIAVQEFFEETTYLSSVAARSDPNAPPDRALAYVAEFSAVVQTSLKLPHSDTPLRSKIVHGRAAHRPTPYGEDARLIASRKATAQAVRGVRLFLCKGGAKRLTREIARAQRE